METSKELHFDGWTLDRVTGELSREGHRVRLQAQPQAILEELLAHPGELVTRQRLIEVLWPKGIVDFDTALNTAMRKLRVALEDGAGRPRYIETVPRRGYRFLVAPTAPAVAAVEVAPPSPLAAPAMHPVRREIGRGWRIAASIALCLVALVALGIGTRSTDRGDWITSAALAAGAEEAKARARYFLKRRLPGDLELARQYFGEALTQDPADADAWAGLSSVHYLDQWEGTTSRELAMARTRAAAERALTLDPRQVEARIRLAIVRECDGDTESAQKLLREAESIAPDDFLLLRKLGGNAAMNGDLATAIAYERRAIAADPIAVSSRQTLVAYLEWAGHYAEALIAQGELEELAGSDPSFVENRVRLLLLLRRYQEALTRTEQLTDATYRAAYRAMALHALGRRAESDEAMQQALGTATGVETARMLAEAHAFRNEHELATSRLRDIAESDPEHREARRSPFLAALRADAPRRELSAAPQAGLEGAG